MPRWGQLFVGGASFSSRGAKSLSAVRKDMLPAASVVSLGIAVPCGRIRLRASGSSGGPRVGGTPLMVTVP